MLKLNKKEAELVWDAFVCYADHVNGWSDADDADEVIDEINEIKEKIKKEFGE